MLQLGPCQQPGALPFHASDWGPHSCSFWIIQAPFSRPELVQGQFIEMSERYMELCDTTVVFVRNVVIEPTYLGATTVAAPGHTHT